MIARPITIVLIVAAAFTITLLLGESALPASRYAPAAFGALVVLATSMTLLRGIRARERWSISGVAAFLGFFVGAALTLEPHGWPYGFAASWVPLVVMLLAGIGRDRLVIELSRLEDVCDDPSRRAGAMARATAIRGDAERAARAVDPKAETRPLHAADARAVFAYAAQVVAYASALDEHFDKAIAALDAVPRKWMPLEMRALMMCNIVFWRLCTGETELAQKEVEAIPDDEAIPEARPIVRVTRAAVHVWAGRPDEGLALVGGADGDGTEPDSLRARFRIVRAHGLAAKGELDAARAELGRALEDPSGEAEVRQWLPARGPAVDLLRERVKV